MMRRGIALSLLGGLLVACAAAGRTPVPADFPTHDSQHGFDLHWRVERTEGAARVVGLVGHPVRYWTQVVLEVSALDAGGDTLRRARATVLPRSFQPVAQPFEVSLPGAEGAARVELRVVDFLYIERGRN